MRVVVPILAAALAAGVLTGCRPREATTVPQTQQPTSGTVVPAPPRVGRVNLEVVAQAHPRWNELNILKTRAARVEGELAVAAAPPPVPATDVQRALTEEAAKMRVSFEQELNSLREERTRSLAAYAEDLKKQQQTRFEEIRRTVEAEAEAAVVAKRDELRAALREAEQAIMEEYRYPLLNLRLRAEVAGLRSEEEGRQLLRQVQALQQEREERIKAKGDEIEQKFVAFQKETETEVNARLKTEQDALNVESTRLIDGKEQELQAELSRAAAERERAFQQRLERRRKELVEAAEATLRGQQGAFARDVDARTKRLRAELLALREQRARLEESILAEVKIEVATIAQAQQLDVVLTRALGGAGGVDISEDVIRKLKR